MSSFTSSSSGGESLGSLLNNLKFMFQGNDSFDLDAWYTNIVNKFDMFDEGFIHECKDMLIYAAKEKISAKDFTEYIESRSIISGSQKTTFMNFWNTESADIHKQIVNSAIFNNKFLSLRWRIDLKSLKKDSTNFNSEPIALFQINNMKKKTVPNSRIIKFEMDRSEVEKMTEQLDIIQSKLQEVAATSSTSSTSVQREI